MAGGRYDPGVTEPALPALTLDGLEAVVFDTDSALTDTASVHAAAWKRLFDEYLTLRTSRGQEPFPPYEEADYLRSIDGRPRYDGVAGSLASRAIQLPWGDPSDPPDREVDGVEADRLGLPGRGRRGRPRRRGGGPPQPVRGGGGAGPGRPSRGLG